MFTFPEKMPKVFRTQEHQEHFEKQGFLIVPFYNEDQIKDIKHLYTSLHSHSGQGFYASTFSSDKQYRQKVDLEIRRISQDSMRRILQDYKEVCGSFIVKFPDEKSGMCVHQDMSLVDESRFVGINIWTPIIDLTVENGTLFLIPGSHRIVPTYRGSSIPEFFSEAMDDMFDFLLPLFPKAGEAVFFDQSIIHYSPPNYSPAPRIVTNIYFTHRDTEYRTYFWDPEHFGNQIEVFQQDDDFMTDFEQFANDIRKRPTLGRSLGLVPYHFPKVNKEFLSAHFPKTDARKQLLEASKAHLFCTTTAQNSRKLLPWYKRLFTRQHGT